MIHEFAVEPEVMATWEHFRLLWEDFGVSRGRFLVEYPKDWRKRVYDVVDRLSKPIRANAIKSKIGDHSMRLARLVGPAGRTFTPGKWLDNALQQQESARPFRAIVTGQDGLERTDVLHATDFARDEEPWAAPTQRKCARTAEALTDAVLGMLCHSAELLLVDRHFDATEPRFTRPFGMMVAARTAWKRLELHTALRPSQKLPALTGKYTRCLAPLVPSGTELKVVLWPGLPDGERLHPRFVLTERGGMHFDYGLDEGHSSNETTLVSLLEHSVFTELRQDYHPNAGKFGKPEVIQMAGRRKA